MAVSFRLARIGALGLMLAAVPVVHAQAVFPMASGQNLTLGSGSNPRTVQTAGTNPAAPVTAEMGGYWFGLGGVGAGYEVGDFDDLIDRAEGFEDRLDALEESTNPVAAAAEAQALETDLGDYLGAIGDAGYLKLFFTAQPPLLPVGGKLSGLGGAFTLGVTAIGGSKIGFVGDCVQAVNGTEVAGMDCTDIEAAGAALDCDVDCDDVSTDFSGYVRAAAGAVVSLGYSGGVYHSRAGSLYMGGRLNAYTLELGKAFIEVGSDDDDDAADQAEDTLDGATERSTEMGLDLGMVWSSHNFRAGATLRNINEPEFAYPDLTDCLQFENEVQDSCLVGQRLAADYPGLIELKETYVMERQLQLESAVYSSDRVWTLSLSYDADPARDATGDEYQWATASASYTPATVGWLVPGFRVGYRQNQAGSELDMLTAGLSLFRVVNLDVAAATDEVENDGDEVPRSAMVNLSFELYF